MRFTKSPGRARPYPRASWKFKRHIVHRSLLGCGATNKGTIGNSASTRALHRCTRATLFLLAVQHSSHDYATRQGVSVAVSSRRRRRAARSPVPLMAADLARRAASSKASRRDTAHGSARSSPARLWRASLSRPSVRGTLTTCREPSWTATATLFSLPEILLRFPALCLRRLWSSATLSPASTS